MRKKQQQQQQTNFYDFASFYSQIQKAYKTYMRTIGILLGGNSSTVRNRMDEIYDLEKKLAKVGFNWVWKDAVVALVPQSRYVLMTIPYPELLSSLSRISFSFPVSRPCPDFGEFRFSGGRQRTYPVNVSRIPNCILVQSRVPGIPNSIPCFNVQACYQSQTFLKVFNVTILSTECQKLCLKLFSKSKSEFHAKLLLHSK